MPHPLRNRLLWGNRRYSDKLLSIQRSSLIAYYMGAESSGTTIVDSSGNGRNGVYTGVDLGQTGIGDGRTAPLWDGVNDYGNILSAISSAFNGDEGSLLFWIKMASSGVWTDGTTRVLFALTTASNLIRLRKVTPGVIDSSRVAGGNTSTVSVSSLSFTGWMPLLTTWSKSANEFKFYMNGVQQGTTQVVASSWSGSMTSAIIGANSTAPANVHSGYLAHLALWSTPLSAPEAARLAVVNG